MSISEERYRELEPKERIGYVKEWACKCKECSKKWHYLDSVEKSMQSQACGNALVGCGMPCFSPITTRNVNDSTNKINELKSCPKCGSSNVTKEAKYFKKEE
jgi:hypothetical protein